MSPAADKVLNEFFLVFISVALTLHEKFLDEQTRNLSYLEYQLNYQMDLESQPRVKDSLKVVAGPSGTAGQETESAGNSPSPPAQKVPKSAPQELLDLHSTEVCFSFISDPNPPCCTCK